MATATTTLGSAQLRAQLHAFVWSSQVQGVVAATIIVNAISLGFQTAELDQAWARAFALVDTVCLAVFVVEIGLKLLADRAAFFRTGWNVFDLLVVAVGLVPGAGSFTVLRALRALRVLRLISVVPTLRRVVDGLGRAIPGVLSVAAILGVIFYVGAVISTTLFGPDFPELFGDLHSSLFTLFQMMTFDDWGEISRVVSEIHPLAPAFFIIFVFVSALTVLNLMVAVIVEAMQGFAAPEERAVARRDIDDLRTEVRMLTEAVERLTARSLPSNAADEPHEDRLAPTPKHD
ncbi:ion transporter [Demequina rhizosphaerae]|uniref:ion transporter n=1 Tax=Demequina rhizosphaerae TaxID=1638985 RepID=UPI0007826CCE|nr:ion transporter [Demequina rhizosphaerae]